MSYSEILYHVKCFTGGATKKLIMDALDDIPVLMVNIDPSEEKPWRKAGKWWSADVGGSLRCLLVLT